ncbi:MAG: hypothetical protein EOP83_27515 [Verrucomicrobiaceae bacterium]|nr:MAG: hypothetical protein EOP83_27515 [Verrucomicrobiaceae bacterium]
MVLESGLSRQGELRTAASVAGFHLQYVGLPDECFLVGGGRHRFPERPNRLGRQGQGPSDNQATCNLPRTDDQRRRPCSFETEVEWFLGPPTLWRKEKFAEV